jgi:hypothetical protein
VIVSALVDGRAGSPVGPRTTSTVGKDGGSGLACTISLLWSVTDGCSLGCTPLSRGVSGVRCVVPCRVCVALFEPDGRMC